MGMNINIIILCARCRRGSRPAVSWCAMPLSMVILSAFVPCPVIVPMLYVLSTYASPAAPHAHAVMLAVPCLVRILPRRVLPCSRAPAAVSWCAMPLYMVVLPAFAPCPVIVPMLYVLSTYARPAAPCAHAVMLAAPCPAVPCLPDQRRPLPPRLPSCRVLVCYAFVYGRTARLCSLPCHCSYAPCIASVCPPCSSTRPCCNAGGSLSRADPAAPCLPCRSTCARCRIYVYVSVCLRVYTFTCLHVYMFTNYRLKWLIYQQYGTHKETNKDRSNEAPAL